jgi:hypothetical protein
MQTKTFALASVAALGLAASAALAEGTVIEITLEDVPSIGGLGDPNNFVAVFDLATALGGSPGDKVIMNGIGWDVQIDTLGTPSWLSEATVYFDDNIAPDYSGLFLSPGAGSSAPGVGSFYAPVQKLADLGIPDIQLPNGELRLEFFESYDDYGVFQDAAWNGSLFVQAYIVPAPAAAAVFGLAGLVGSRRRRG